MTASMQRLDINSPPAGQVVIWHLQFDPCRWPRGTAKRQRDFVAAGAGGQFQREIAYRYSPRKFSSTWGTWCNRSTASKSLLVLGPQRPGQLHPEL